MSVKIAIDLSEFQRVWKEKTDAFKEAIRRGLEEAGALVKSEIESRASVRTGALRSSVVVDVEGNAAKVGPTATYSPYVEFGTRASPGRYVPAIERRLVNPTLPHFGMHPGIRATHFVEQSALASEPQIEAVFETIMAELME